MVGLVSAIAYGSTINQDTIDSVDMTTRDLNAVWTESYSDLVTKCEGKNICSRDYSIDGYEKQMLENSTDNSTYWSGLYIYIRENKTIRFSTKWVYDIEAESGRAAAKDALSEFLEKRFGMSIETQRRKLASIQTEMVYDISDVFDSP